MIELKQDDYVLATKYVDGHPLDEWCVGFFSGMLDNRFMLVDTTGRYIRNSGFSRAKKITNTRGKWLLDNRDEIILSNRSLWTWLRCSMQPIGYV